jgi:hypothetical protein
MGWKKPWSSLELLPPKGDPVMKSSRPSLQCAKVGELFVREKLGQPIDSG